MSGLWVLVICISVLLVGTTGARVIVYEVRQARHARHVLRTSGQFPDNSQDNFYGSMTLPPKSHNELDWRERTMAELAPEALDDPGPGVASSPDPPSGPDQELTALLGGVSPRESLLGRNAPTGQACVILPATSPASLAPVHERLAGIGDIHEAHQSHPHPEDGWLDAQLADLYDWVRTQLEAA